MQDKLIETLYSEWTEELKASLYESRSLYVALFSADGRLLLVNKTMDALFKGEPALSLINPSFEKLKAMEKETPLIYNGNLTIGNKTIKDTSILARVYRKNERILILGGVDVSQLVDQNNKMHQLNAEISHLQRQLIKEKVILQDTLIQLNQANAELKEANATKDKFLSVLAHDLKNPFSVLLGFSDLLLENYTDFSTEQVTEQIEIIQKTVHKTYHLLEDLLLWSRSQLGRITYLPNRVVLETLCLNVAETLQGQALKKAIRIDVAVSPDVEILADENMLKTILRNLVSNAIKFSWRGSTVVLSAELGADFVTISVADQGVGLSPENEAKIWVLSEQISTVGTDNEEGSGLGLLLCKEFTEKHGGTIWVVSQPGKGCDFRFTIPRFFKL